MSVLATDAFTRADSASLGANWTLAKGADEIHGILTNQAKHTTSASRDASYYSAVTAPDNQYSQAVVVALTATSMAVTVRSITSGTTRNSYYAGHDKNDFGGLNTLSRIWKDVANVATSLGTGATTLAAGQTWYLEAQSTTIIMKINGTQEISATDSAHSAGQFGIWDEHNAANVAVWDTWEGGDFAAAGGTGTGMLLKPGNLQGGGELGAVVGNFQ